MNEPVRTYGYLAGGIVALATVATTLGVAAEWTPQIVALAIGAGLGEFAVVALGVEKARSQAWGPENHAAAVAYAFSLDPESYDGAEQVLLDRAGVGSIEEAKRMIGEIE